MNYFDEDGSSEDIVSIIQQISPLPLNKKTVSKSLTRKQEAIELTNSPYKNELEESQAGPS